MNLSQWTIEPCKRDRSMYLTRKPTNSISFLRASIIFLHENESVIKTKKRRQLNGPGISRNQNINMFCM